MGIEDIKNRVKSCVEHVLKDVRHMPRVRRNLILLGEHHCDGYIYKADRDTKIRRSKKDKYLVIKGKRTKNNLTIAEGGAKEKPCVAILSVEFTKSEVENLATGSSKRTNKRGPKSNHTHLFE